MTVELYYKVNDGAVFMKWKTKLFKCIGFDTKHQYVVMRRFFRIYRARAYSAEHHYYEFSDLASRLDAGLYYYCTYIRMPVKTIQIRYITRKIKHE